MATHQLAAIHADLQRLQQVINEIPHMRMDLELLRAELEAMQGSSAYPGAELRSVVQRVVAEELRPLQRDLAALRAECQRGEPNQSWAQYLGLSSPSLPPDKFANFPSKADPHYDTHEDSDESEAYPPGAEPLQHIVHEEYEASRFLGLEITNFKASVWDSSLIVMLHICDSARKVVGNFNVVLSFFLLLVNLVVQVCLVLAVNSMADVDPMDRLVGVLRSQRVREGQSYQHFDRKDLITKTQQICDEKIYNEMQSATEWLANYLNAGDTLGKLSGQYICLIAMFVWVTSMAIELRQVLHDQALVILSLPRTDGTRYELRNGRYIITGIAGRQKVMALLLVILPRTLIAVFLLWLGLIYLSGTINIDDLILNAVALEFIKNVDELLFEALVPRRMAAMVSNMAIQIYVSAHHTLLPNELRRDRVGLSFVTPETRRGLSISVQSFYAMFRVAYIAAILAAAWFYYLEPVAQSTQNAYDAVCGHDTTFTYMLHPVTNIPVFAHVDPLEPGRHDKEELRCFYAAQYEMVKLRAGFPSDYLPENSTLLAMIGGFHPLCKRKDVWGQSDVACPETSLQYFERASMTGPEDFYANQNKDCRDQDVFFVVLHGVCTNPKFTVYTAGELDFFRETLKCSDLRNHCHSSLSHSISLPWFWQLQKTCPQTCGMCHKDT